ncbi:ribonuclease catalytic domain-containing protein [Desulfonatronospira sp. MSAO_Bac3]|uniref:ribonuclease catalytic domain-containing protein n=1 Tax=Desulfonatronospira sp. MSAO_Bac3 TaxID=2293857 RepID=UPI000FF6DBD5|nr:ribonuclease catalytic domain-containing protein [Desulfonatronospira sp. MSAO_Bac3]RQD75133.1 MAG: RNB domain-containing ribonuclease [Desulfonatronospira sp. MSAO_Bac3]
MNDYKHHRAELRPGQVVEYLQNNQPLVSWIQEVQSPRVRVLNINQREVKLPIARVMPWTGPVYSPDLSRQDVLQLLQEHHHRRNSIQEDLDVMDVWSMAQGEIVQASIFWFAGLIWDEPDADRTAALGRAMLQARTHFKFSPPDFEVFSRETAEKKMEEERLHRERERLVSIGKDFFRKLHSGEYSPGDQPEPEDSELAGQLKNILVQRIKNPEDPHTQDLWSKLSAGLPQDPHLPFILARAWGIYPEHYNYMLEQAAYAWEDSWSKTHDPEIQALSRKLEQESGEPAVDGLISIDSASTRDIDDAFYIREHADGYSLTLALAGPGLYWTFGSELDRDVAHRVSSLYLPEGKSDMLPRILAEEMFSLNQGQRRPAMVLDIDLDFQGIVYRLQPRLEWVRVQANRTYAEVEDELAMDPASRLGSALRLARTLRAKRLEQGAVIIEQNEPIIRLEHTPRQTLVSLMPGVTHPGAHLIVSEFMLLCNTVLASWAREKDIPLLYRTQDIVLPKDYSGVWRKPEEIYRVIRSMGATLTETRPRPHRSIGAGAYASVTSPLRRYVDLVNQAQIAAALSGHPVRDRTWLEKMLPFMNTRMGQVSRIQKFRPRYWKLLYFKQQARHTTWTGVVVDNSGPVVLSLPREQVLIRAPHEVFGGKTMIGQAFRLRLGRIDPLNNEIHVLEAWEE